MHHAVYRGDVILTNLASVASTPHHDPGLSAITNAAAGNPQLRAALEALPGYTEGTEQIDRIVAASTAWAAAAPAKANPEAVFMRAVEDGGDLTDAPALLAEAEATIRRTINAHEVAASVIRTIIGTRHQAVHGGKGTMLAVLDKRLAGTVKKLTKNPVIIEGIDSADVAVAAGKGDAWAEATTLKADIADIRRAQQSIIRALLPSIHDRVRANASVRLATTMIDRWQDVEPRLPQIKRHGGLWNSDKHESRPDERLEVWTPCWPANPEEHTDWLLAHHPERMRVLSPEEMTSQLEALDAAEARTTPTGRDRDVRSPITRRPATPNSAMPRKVDAR